MDIGKQRRVIEVAPLEYPGQQPDGTPTEPIEVDPVRVEPEPGPVRQPV